jgi:predicted dienelactone hydrolase
MAWRAVRLVLRGIAALAAAIALAVVALVVFLWIEHGTTVELPALTGPFAVGRVIEDWTGQGTDALAPVAGTRRELLVWIWYPAVATPRSVNDDYLPLSWRKTTEKARPALITNFLTRDLSKVRAHSLRNADLSPREPSYPVVIVRAGASGEVVNYSALAEDLASHGYVVVGFDAPYRTGMVSFPDGRVIARRPENNPELCVTKSGPERERCAGRILGAWISDISFVLDRLQRIEGEFAGRLDLTRVGAFGHSFGGATALQFCHDDPRCKAGVDIDGAPEGSVVRAGIHQPFMFLLGDHLRDNDPESLRIKANIKSIYDRLPADGRSYVAIRGANHFTFSDDGALLKSHALRGLLRLLGKLHISGRRQLAVTSYCLHSFFDAHLKGANGSRPAIPSPLYPEIVVIE